MMSPLKKDLRLLEVITMMTPNRAMEKYSV